MAFGTLEDLDDTIDLVFFPRTWKDVRMEVKVDQVVVVSGQVQHKDLQTSLLVDSLSTTIEISQDADRLKKPITPPTYTPPVATSHKNGNGTNGHSAKQNGNGRSPQTTTNGHPTKTKPQDAPTKAAPVIKETMIDNMPPPPPNFDEGMFDDLPPIESFTEVPEPDFTPSDREKSPAVVKESAPTPAVVKESAPTPAVTVPKERPVAAAEVRPVAKTAVSPARKKPHTTPQLVIEIKQVSNWRSVCHRAIDCVAEYEGDDPVLLKVVGLPYSIKLSNQRTNICSDLMERLRMISGVGRVTQR
jgi:hypothetical protein